MISLDTEATGLDLRHGARPFMATIATESGKSLCYAWNVDPLTRKVKAAKSDLLDIQKRLDDEDIIVLQNAKFDYLGLRLLFEDNGLILRWNWRKYVIRC